MFSKKNRLPRKDFQRVMEKGKSVRTSILFLRFLETSNKDFRFGVAVSKKLAKNAAEKNRWKRVLRSVGKDVLKNKKGGIDVVLIAGEKATQKSFEELLEEATKLFKKAGIIT